LSRKFGKWIGSTLGVKSSKIDAKIRQRAVHLKTIEIIVEFRKPETREGWRGMEGIGKKWIKIDQS